MARARRYRAPPDAWPGFVDALSTLLMVIIFMLVVFVLGQFFLSRMLEGQNTAVDLLRSDVLDLTTRLEREREAASALRVDAAKLDADLRVAVAARDDARADLALAEADRAAAATVIAGFEDEEAKLRRLLEAATARSAAEGARASDLEADAARLEAALADARRAFAANGATLEVNLAELAVLKRDVEDLRDLRQRLEAEVALRAAALSAREAETLALREERDAATARAQSLASLMAALTVRLDAATSTLEERDATIADLGGRLDAALADKVVELSQARSEFFGKLRRVLGEREEVRIVGDRFVFQSEVLFTTGQAEIEPGGRARLAALADTFKTLVADIPENLPWVLQVDGHTDRVPISTFRFPSNWELSAARAISVTQFLAEQGLPPERLAARAFASFQPLDEADTLEAYRRNRRIEIKLTTR